MPIMSANRFTGIGRVNLTANKDYYNATMGQILSESVANDANLFAAIYQSDRAEIAAIREGTLLEAEAKEKSDKEKKTILQKIKDGILAFARKVMAFLDSAITKIMGMLGLDVKKKVTKYKKALTRGKTKTEIEKIKLKNFRNSIDGAASKITLKPLTETFNESWIRTHSSTEAEDIRKELIAKCLPGVGNNLKTKDAIKSDDILNCFLEKAKDTTVGAAVFTSDGDKGIDGLIKACESGGNSPAVKDIKDAKKKVKDAVGKVINDIGRFAKKDDTMDTKAIRMCALNLQQVTGELCSALVRNSKYEVKRNSGVLSRCITKIDNKVSLKEESADFAYLCAIYEADDILESPVDEEDVEYALDAAEDED